MGLVYLPIHGRLFVCGFHVGINIPYMDPMGFATIFYTFNRYCADTCFFAVIGIRQL